MSDPHPGPHDNPYGTPPPVPPAPPAQNAYGQPAPGQQGYGQPPYGQPNPGQPQGYQPYGHPAPMPRDPNRRPATVTAAAWITIITSALMFLVIALLGLVIVAMAGDLEQDLLADPELQDSGISGSAVMWLVGGTFFAFAAWAVIAIVLAVFVLRRSNAARILLVISAVMTALLSALAIMSVVSGVLLATAIAVIVLLFVGGANDWFAGDDLPAMPYPGPGAGGSPGQGTGTLPPTHYSGSNDDETWPPRDYPGRA